MENKKLSKSVGRPKYQPNKKLLKSLFKQVADKTITNEQGWKIAGCKKTKWFELKKEYERAGGMI